MLKTIAAATAAAVLVGCAHAPPNTPGAGIGDTYTPFIDMQGLDMARYSRDLDGCRAYAKQIDPGRAEMQGMVAGAILGALIGAAVGGNRYQANQGALYGGGAGIGAGGAKARSKQETILANCMAGRGYRVLEGATIPASTSVPSPYLQAGTPAGYVPAAAAIVSAPATSPPPVFVPTADGTGEIVNPDANGCGWLKGSYVWKCRPR